MICGKLGNSIGLSHFYCSQNNVDLYVQKLWQHNARASLDRNVCWCLFLSNVITKWKLRRRNDVRIVYLMSWLVFLFVFCSSAVSVYKLFCTVHSSLSHFVSAGSAFVLFIPTNFEWDFGSVNISETKALLNEESFGNVSYVYCITKFQHMLSRSYTGLLP